MGACVWREGNALPVIKAWGLLPMPLTPVRYIQHSSPVTCEKHISDVEAIGHDHVEETMGYEHTMEGMSELMEAMRQERPEKTLHYHFCADTIMISYGRIVECVRIA